MVYAFFYQLNVDVVMAAAVVVVQFIPQIDRTMDLFAVAVNLFKPEIGRWCLQINLAL